jgi:hypothetical protein
MQGVVFGPGSLIEEGVAELFAAEATYAEGTFTPLYDGYPAGALQPTGPVRLLSGEEYTAAREAASAANDAAHAADPTLKGLQIHEVTPVKFGGSPTDFSNKIALTQAEHSPISTWWFRLQRYVEGVNGK